ncbi:uncharacterized protein LOC130994451 [Salvia miltiorrhiza]|uniref:uncharacterized protein LOC130994451 n=1 Tax=Salvia miltiorrhiza TaxID=226208 RepID=UPI0025ACD4BD|nr:uncharacterized protein LOC130994451 [Salvia miltiorrhiza]
MKVLSYNIRGLGSKVKKREIRELIQKQGIDFCLIQESKLESIDEIVLKTIWGTEKCGFAFRKAEGRSGGILSTWNSSSFLSSSNWEMPGALIVNGRWIPERENLWNTIGLVIEQSRDLHVCIGGDFNSSVDWGPKPFRFINAWVSHPDFLEVVRTSWNQSGITGWRSFVFKQKFKRLKEDLKKWNKTSFGSIEENIGKLKNDICCWDAIDDTMGLEDDEIIKRNESVANLFLQLKNRDSLLSQKARDRWLTDGDVNSNYFHKVINGRRLKNDISGLQVRDRWLEEPEEVKQEIRTHFQNQFKEREMIRPHIPEDFVSMKISNDMKTKLEQQFTEEEVKAAVWNCDGRKSPGPDGFNFLFFKTCWEIIKEDLIEVMKEFHSHGKLVKGSNPSFIVLIPKKNTTSELKDFRPISLINCLYKVIAKILALRMKQVIHSIISDCQSAFVEGRFILDGVISLNEIIDEVKKRKKRLTLFKVDFAKAFDTVDWKFIDLMLEKMNFSQKWRNWISECLGSATANVLVNGSPSGEFRLERGLRQGDPLSPFLFLVAAEGLHLITERVVQKNLLEPAECGNGAIRISHLQYADDTIFVVSGKEQNAWALKCILKIFEMLSGLKVNFDKSCLLGIGIPTPAREQLAATLNCQVGDFPTKYLGILIGARLSRAEIWNHVVEKIKRKVFSWQHRKISLAGRITVNEGGLGLKDLESFNKALMVKWIWRFLKEEDALWVRVVKARMGDFQWDENGICLANNRQRILGWWNRVVALSRGDEGKWLRESLELQLGEGDTISFWHHCWTGNHRLRDQFPTLFRLSTNQDGVIKEMRLWVEGVWVWKLEWSRELRGRDLGLLTTFFAIINPFKACAGKKDGWSWKHSSCGLFSVNSAYKAIRSNSNKTEARRKDSVYTKIWNAPAPFKAKTTAWRIMKGRLATCENLIKREVISPSTEANCILCATQTETLEHLLFTCPKADEIWFDFLGWIGKKTALHRRTNAHFLAFTSLGSKADVQLLTGIWICIVWSIWKERNNCKFNQGEWNRQKIVAEIKTRIWSWKLAFKIQSSSLDFKDFFSNSGILC